MSYSESNEFIEKLFAILKDEHHAPFITWDDTGKLVVIVKPRLLGESVLNKYYKHGNLNTFIRQLNKYGFSKRKNSENLMRTYGNEVMIFSHKNFVKEGHNMLYLIKRKKTVNSRKNNRLRQLSEARLEELIHTQENWVNAFTKLAARSSKLENDIYMLKEATHILRAQGRPFYRALICEDNYSTGMYIKCVMEGFDYLSYLVVTRETFLYRIHEGKYSVVLLSSSLFDLCEYMRCIREVDNNVLIVVTYAQSWPEDNMIYNFGKVKIIGKDQIRSLFDPAEQYVQYNWINAYCEETFFG